MQHIMQSSSTFQQIFMMTILLHAWQNCIHTQRQHVQQNTHIDMNAQWCTLFVEALLVFNRIGLHPPLITIDIRQSRFPSVFTTFPFVEVEVIPHQDTKCIVAGEGQFVTIGDEEATNIDARWNEGCSKIMQDHGKVGVLAAVKVALRSTFDTITVPVIEHLPK